MKKIFLLLTAAVWCLSTYANEPDSAYIFSYATDKNSNKNGLHFAWSIDRENWRSIGNEYSFIKSDYGNWGSQKRMIMPFLYQAPDGLWHCVWSVNESDGAFAHASSTDLVNWKPQSYPVVMPDGNCLTPAISYDKTVGQFVITWASGDTYYTSITKDFKNYTEAEKIPAPESGRTEAEIFGKTETGTVNKVAWSVIDNLIRSQQVAAYRSQLNSERVAMNPDRFKEPIEAAITAEPEKGKDISDLLIGIFFEDISYAADGGIYAELVQNRGFEYDPGDKTGRDKSWNSYKAWSTSGNGISFTIDTVSPIHINNKHYAALKVGTQGSGLVNEGFDGIPVKAGEKYDFSVFARSPEAKRGKLTVRLVGKNGEVYGETSTKAISNKWNKYETVITARETVKDARLEVIPQMTGRVDLDMISLFPQKTFKNRKNGLRADLAQVIADMNPRFVRFPGGCAAHGDGLDNMYLWQNTIGPLEARKPQRNIWNYHQSAGLGYYEYFLFCKDIGAEPLPVIPAAVPCQNSKVGGAGQQGGVPMCDMDDFVQDVLNLIEWANGDPKKSGWAKMRADAGHPKPFNLKYLGVGNEDLITEIFEERFKMIFDAVKEKHPEITVIGTVGPFYEGSDYVEGWRFAAELNVPIVDEHYYNPPGWYLNNQDFYDRYDRSKPKVYLGEYASHVPGRHNNIETALTEALHLTTCERNGDVVVMTSYAPLLAKHGYTSWTPDLIYFNNTEVFPTVGYHVQKLFGQNAGDQYIPSAMSLTDSNADVSKRVAKSIVRDSKTGDVIVKLVNLLPVAVKSSVDLSSFNIPEQEAEITVLQGAPDDRNAKPETSTMAVSGKFSSELPAYSFTVIRVKTK